jgi:hypothetical protein
MRVLALALTGLGLFAVGCGDVAVVDDIEININVKNADLDAQGVLVTEKNISTEQGNPYGTFLGQIKEELGDDLAAIDLNAAVLTLDAGGTQAALEQIYTGEVQLVLVDETNNTATTIATITDPTGTQAEMDVVGAAFDDEVFQTTLNEGSFKVQLRGQATDAAANINVNIVSSLSFEAE